jgi:hypothetical protein
LQSADAIKAAVFVRSDSRPAEVFYGLNNFRCKTARLCVTRCEWGMNELLSVSNDAQSSENMRKNSFLNYESPALTAELQAVAH